MSAIRFGGMIQFKDEMPENLPRAIASMRKLCDYVVGYDDGSTDGSTNWAAAHVDHLMISPEPDWKNELQHKHKMLEHLRSVGVDWVLWMDADEELMRGTPDAARAMIAARPDLTGICLSEINLWADEQHYRIDRQFGDAGFLRLWKMRPELRYTQEQIDGGQLHLPQFPPAAREKIESLGYPSPGILHYSWSTPEKIIAKHERYRAQGQCGESLDRLAPDANAVRLPVKPEWFWPKE
jgi:glycosyltransferase involved in cell wall biosynthesis